MNTANRFRFRVWDDHDQNWLPPKKLLIGMADGLVRQNGVAGFIGGVTIEQSTGLTDRNGTEVFEGDIIRHEEWHGGMEHKAAEQDAASRGESIDWTRLYAVVWEQAIHAGGWVMQRNHCTLTFVDGEVIGNIHENPELLDRAE